jgi:hemin uptake protein HemP
MNFTPTHRDAPDATDAVKAQPVSGTAVRRELDSGVLFAGGSEVVIVHGAETYCLRLTRQNKLILTK